MRKIIIAASLTFFTWFASAGELHVATVDLQEILRRSEKAKLVVRAVQLQEISFTKELDRLKLEGRKLVEEAENLQTSFNDQALSPTERESRRKRWEEKVQDVNAFSVRYDQFRQEKESELRISLERGNRKVLEEIATVTRRIGEKEGLHLVLNMNKENPAAGEVLFSKGITDITSRVLAGLDGDKGQAGKADKNSDATQRR